MKNKFYFFLKFLPVMMTTGFKPALHLKIPLFAVLLLLGFRAAAQLPHLVFSGGSADFSILIQSM